MSQQWLVFASLSSITVRFNKLETFVWPHLTAIIQGGKVEVLLEFVSV